MRVKICGITSLEEAHIAIRCGADAVGFLTGLDYPTDDEIDAADARKIIVTLPPFVSSVLVTHKKDPDWVVDTCQHMGCSTIQLHGEFAMDKIPELRSRLPYVRIIKAVHVINSESIALAARVAECADAVLLDTKTESRIGGTGITHDWSISAEIVKQTARPVILSGGLNPENVIQAIAKVAPYAVDVNTGVENPGGSKSLEKISAFIRSAKEPNRHARIMPKFSSEPG